MIGRRWHDDAQSFEEAWNGRAPQDEHIADLVAFAEGLCEAAVAEPSLEFRTNLRSRLMTEAATVLVPMPGASRATLIPARAAPRRARRRIATVTATLVASAGAVSLVASSASAVPGELLYSVKRTVESVELTLHQGDASRGSFQLAQASERLAEARELSTEGASETLIAETLDDFSSAAADGSTRLFTDFSANGEERSIQKVNDFAAASSVDLSELSSTLPEGVDESFAAATDAVTKLATEASSLCKSCANADVQSLVSAVSGLAASKPPADKGGADDEPDTAKNGSSQAPGQTQAPSSAGKPAASGPTASTPDKAPTPAPTTSAPVVPTKTPSLSDLTNPLLGGLLGDDDQVGLVPGLLSGLLGGGAR